MKRFFIRFILVFLALSLVLTGCANGDPLGLVGVKTQPEEQAYTIGESGDITPSDTPESSTSQPSEPAEPEKEKPKPPSPLAVEGVDHVGGFVDFSGVWRTWSSPSTGICKGKVNAGRFSDCDYNAGARFDWMQLEPVETAVREGFIDVSYTGEYHHYHSYFKRIKQYEFQTNAHMEEYVYNLSGNVTYSLDGGWIDLGIGGYLRGTPRYDHVKTLGITGEGNSFGIILSEDPYYPGELRRPARVPDSASYRFRFIMAANAKGSEGDAPEGMGNSFDSMYLVNDRHLPIFWRSLIHDAQPLQAKGTISGTVEHKFSITIDRGTIQLFNQDSDTVPIQVASIVDEKYSFQNVPIFLPKAIGKGLRRAIYTVKVVHAEADVDEQVFGQPVAYFMPDMEVNVHVPETVDFKLDGAPEVGIKKSLIQQLSDIGKINYTAQEKRADDWVTEAARNELDAVKLEQLRRGIWAERVVLEGASSAQSALQMTLKSFANLLAELYGDLADVQSQRLSSSRQFQEKRNLFEEGKLNPANAPRLLGVDPAMKGSYGMALDRLAKRADWADQAGVANKVTKMANFAIFNGLKAAGMDTDDAKQLAKWFVVGFRSILDYIASGSLKGSTVAVKTAITHIVESVHPVIFDNRAELDIPDPYIGKIQFDDRIVSVFPSYTKSTEPLLKIAVDEMIDWDTADFDTYQKDSQATADILNEMVEAWSNLSWRHGYYTAVMNTADMSADVFELLGKAHPWFEFMKKASFVVKYVANGPAIVDPAVYFFKRAPDYTLEGVFQAYGKEPETAALIPDNGPAAVPVTFRTENRNIANSLDTVEDTAVSYADVIARLYELLRANEIGKAIELTSGGTTDSYEAVRNDYNQEVSLLINKALSISPEFSGHIPLSRYEDALLEQVNLNILEADMAERMWKLYNNAMLGEYQGPGDPYYIAERNIINYTGQLIVQQMETLDEKLTILSGAVSSIDMLPAVTLYIAPPESAATGGDTITETGEEFKIIAHIRNAGSVTVSNAAAVLLVASPKNSVTVSGEQVLPVGNLAADDGVRGSGDDEAEVVWTVRYNGDLTEEAILFQVNLLEGGSEPVSFVAFESYRSLLVDPLQTDTDLDGMLDEYEMANGLDTSRDDYEEDKDGDGLTNGKEFTLNTDADNSDTDGDGLSDFEEVNGGEDGFVTDPVKKDTDDDGVNDDVDGAPDDPERSEAGEISGEPVVAVDKTTVYLTRESPVVTVIVSNSAEGDLYWTAGSLNDSLAITPFQKNEVSNGQILIISIPAGFIFESEEAAETIIRVIDAYGLDTDYVDITVRVSP
ncbi:hypothetical protein ACFLUG_02680 [Chloroflexota bacterium]